MPPLEVITQAMRDRAPKKRIKFVRNTCEGGVDFGPDYEQDTVEVPQHRADFYIRQGRAVEAEAEAEAEPGAPAPPAEKEPPQTEKPAPAPRQRG